MLVAKYMDELSVQKIVETFGGTVESVRSRIARARRLFKERFPIGEEFDREVRND